MLLGDVHEGQHDLPVLSGAMKEQSPGIQVTNPRRWRRDGQKLLTFLISEWQANSDFPLAKPNHGRPHSHSTEQ